MMFTYETFIDIKIMKKSSYLFVAVLLSGLGNCGTLLALTKVVVAEEVEERLSPGGLEEDMAPAP